MKYSYFVSVAAHSPNPVVHHLFRALLEYAPSSFLARQEQYLNDLSYMDEFKLRISQLIKLNIC